MSELLLQKMASLGLKMAPIFNQGVVRVGAEWFIGKQLIVDGKEIQLAWFGDFRSGVRGDWRSELIETLSDDAREKTNAEIAQALAREKEEREKHWLVVAEEAQALWDGALATFEHDYLKRKKLSGPHGTRLHINEHDFGVLLVPMFDVAGKLWNVTRIYSTDFIDKETGENRGNKFLLKSGRKEGLFHTLGKIHNNCVLYLCEGFATGASIKEALPDATVVVCFDAGNLPVVARELKQAYPQATFVICGDDDVWKPEKGNKGREKALEAAQETGGIAVFPRFKNTSTLPTDFNDLACLEGLESVKHCVMDRGAGENVPGKMKSSKALNERLVAEKLVEAYAHKLVKQDDDFFEYSEDHNHWVHYSPKAAADHFMRIIDSLAGAGVKFRDIQSVFKRFSMHVPSVPRGSNMFAPPPYVTNFKNGALELLPKTDGTFELNFRAKRREDLLCYSHPFDYSPDAPKNDEFEETVSRVLGQEEDAINAFYEVLGACLVPAFPKVVLFVGPPGSGKSTLILLAYHLIDKALRCSVDPSDWKKFAMETMAGKLVNMNPDIALSRPIAANILKQIEDRVPVRIERKNQTDIYAPLPAMHLFGANGLPKTIESVEAFTRRVIIFKCDKYKAPETGFIKDFAHHVWSKNPQGVVMRAIQGAKKLASNKGHFALVKSSKKAMENWIEDTEDYVAQFLKELKDGGIKLPDANSTAMLEEAGKIDRVVMNKCFQIWFTESAPRRVPPDTKELYRRLRELGIEEYRTKTGRYFIGLGVKETPNCEF